MGHIFKNLLLEIVFGKFMSDRITNWLVNRLVPNDLHKLENSLREYVRIVSSDLGVCQVLDRPHLQVVLIFNLGNCIVDRRNLE